jgi:hypothetical protein
MSTFTISVPEGSCPLLNALRRGALEVLGRFRLPMTHHPQLNSKNHMKGRDVVFEDRDNWWRREFEYG